MDAKLGLSTKEAFSKLCDTLESEIGKERERLLAAEPLTFRFLAHDALTAGSFCLVYAIASVICCIVLLIGTYFRNCSFLDLFASVLFLIITLANIYLSSRVYRAQRFTAVAKASDILEMLKQLGEENFEYEHLYAPQSDAICLQWTYRDHKLVNVPWMLLVSGDVVKLRAGQAAPCRCVSQQGAVIDLGDKPKILEMTCAETRGVIPLKSTTWEVVKPPVVEFLRTAFRDHHKKRSNLLNSEIINTLHFSLERCLFPVAFAIAFGICCFRYFFIVGANTADFLVNTTTIIIPLLAPVIPMYCLFGKLWNMGFVLGDGCKLRYDGMNSKYVATCIFVDRNKKGSVIDGIKAVYNYFKGDIHASIDFVFTCGGLTSCAFLDKKGLLSWPNATIEKVLCFHSDDPVKQGNERKVTPKILDLTMDGNGSFRVHFDDPSWKRYKKSLLPFGISNIVNGCSLLPYYSKFLDHISAVSETVPNTIAVSNRRCFCALTGLLGISKEVTKQFSTSATKIVGFYKRLAGEESECEHRKFQTPLENAFLTITKDATSKYYHVMSQGTADLLLNACSHVWCDNSLEPYTLSLHKRVLDFYQRNAMTGFCLVLGYRTLGCTISDTLSERYIDVPLLDKNKDANENCSVPRTISLDMECLKSFYRQSPINTADECIGEVMHGQTLCGLVVLQHQARNDIVHLVEQLDYACVRFIYFSKENELRSRVFAEKLGLEAGWNCHISLASEDGQLKTTESALDKGDCPCNHSAELPMHRSATWSEYFPKQTGHYSIRSFENTFRKSSIRSSCDSCLSPPFFPPLRHLSSKSAASLKDSQSRRSAYSWSDESAPGLFPNKAKLPSGITNIRPHLENVDNVPLLVNLFTDCDHKSSQKMIEIMQDYGEIVLVVGSSLNYFNGSILSQGNCSVSIEPQHPALCSKENSYGASSLKKASTVATLLMGLCSDIVVFPNQTVDLISLIAFCRHQLRMFRSSLLFFLFSSIALLLQQIFSLLLLLPNIFCVFQVFLFIVLYVPLLSVSLMASPHEHGENRDEIAPKNIPSAPRRLIRRAIIYFSINFLPTQLFVSFIYYSTVMGIQERNQQQENLNSSFCSVNRAVIVGRHFAAFCFLVYLCALSMGFVYFRCSCWTKIPLRNFYWVGAVWCVILLQVIYTSLSVGGSLLQFVADCNIWAIAMSFLWIIIVIIIAELCKLHFIKLYRRDQRRRKLSFNTKLGMNSPY